ncbi:MAG: CapA family protein [Victivallaceae bacterium]|nr:CapA family protein [Victivallaceae bacterium]
MLKFTDGFEQLKPSSTVESISIAITGDCCPFGAALEPILAGKSADILKGIQPFLDSADLRIIQFEAPLTNDETPIPKSGPNLKCPPECVEFVKAGDFAVALLANNHTGDYGPAPIIETIEILEQNGTKTVGAGKNAVEAAKPLIIEKNGFTISIINIGEHEFGRAGHSHAGSAALDPLVNITSIRRLKKSVDIVLVILHGGTETNPVPRPKMVQTCRAFAEAGASAVMNIHTHCPQGIEIWEGTPIIYSPGNFYFPSIWEWKQFDPKEFWWTGYIPKISFDKSGAMALEIMPFMFSPDPEKIEPLTGDKKDKFYEYLAEISAILADDLEIERYFDAWCASRGANALTSIRKVSANWPIDATNYDQLKSIMPLRNIFTCESHHELVSRYLCLLEDNRLDEAGKYIEKIEKLQVADF